MSENDPNTPPPEAGSRWSPARLPRWRTTLLLAAATLAVGVGVGAAVGPAPETSLASQTSPLGKTLPLLISQIQSERQAAADEAAAAAAAKAAAAAAKTATTATEAKAPAAEEASSSAPEGGEEEAAGEKEAAKKKTGKKGAAKTTPLPPVSSVWLIELAGTTFESVIAQPAAASYLNEVIGQGTLAQQWSALEGAAFAGEAGLLEAPAAGATPPLLHTIVQPPCPEGEAGAACASETPGQLTAASEFLKATLATITNTPAYKEHGLIVITLSTVGLASQTGLPEGTSTATLTQQPPSGVLLLSPFAKADSTSKLAFDPTSPRQTVEKLLHK